MSLPFANNVGTPGNGYSPLIVTASTAFSLSGSIKRARFIIPAFLLLFGVAYTVLRSGSANGKNANPMDSVLVAYTNASIMSANMAGTEVAAIINEFGLALLKAVHAKNSMGQVFISPFSITNALGMVALGATAGGKAQQEIFDAWGLNASSAPVFFDRLHKHAAKMMTTRNGTQLLTANSVWCKSTIKHKFAIAAQNKFDAEVKVLPDSPAPINAWCNTTTNGMIPSIIDQIDSFTAAVLVNAVYFKGSWTEKFNSKLSVRGVFNTLNHGKQPCAMMKRTAKMHYAKADGVQIVQLPYGEDHEFVATVLLPSKEKSALIDLVKELGAAGGAATLASRLKQLRLIDVALQLPRFKMEFGVHDMKAELKSTFGMHDVFDGEGGFLAMSDDKQLHLSSVLHKAVVEVNEEGTKCAAATAGTMVATSIEIPTPPIKFIVDRPFIFLVRNAFDDLLLFAGVVEDPELDVQGL